MRQVRIPNCWAGSTAQYSVALNVPFRRIGNVMRYCDYLTDYSKLTRGVVDSFCRVWYINTCTQVCFPSYVIGQLHGTRYSSIHEIVADRQ